MQKSVAQYNWQTEANKAGCPPAGNNLEAAILFSAINKAFLQLGDPAIRRILWICLFTTLGVFTALWVLLSYALSLIETGWLSSLVQFLGGAAVLILTWLLFPTVAITITRFFLDDVADAVENRHYPHLPPASGETWGSMILTSLSFLVLLLFFNVLILIFIFFPPFFPFVFYAVNGYLLGREFFELIALRRLDRREVRALWRKQRWLYFIPGVAVAFLLTVPIVNLLTPIVAAATMVHLFEAWRPDDRQPQALH
ncbi:MAG: EI24 domain-containing protein [Rhodospirillaceae bacterium]